MRENIARIVFWLTLGTVLALSAQFAAVHNPQAPSTGDPVVGSPSQSSSAQSPVKKKPEGDVERGQIVYVIQKCATCHSIAGVGNPRHSLDGVGMRWDETELRAWITGTGIAAEILSPQIIKRKERYQSLPEEDMKALVAYLATLQSDFARQGKRLLPALSSLPPKNAPK
jgi:mono/diheme cytochrome c family protein